MNPQTIEDLTVALIEFGWTESEVNKLSSGDNLLHLRAMLELSPHQLNPPKTVDFSDNVNVEGLTVNWNLKQKSRIWNPDNFGFFQSAEQLRGQYTGTLNYGFDARDKHNPVNACLLQYLLFYPFLIPKEWRQYPDGRVRYICFLGTTYLDLDYQIFARGMYFKPEKNIWQEGFWPLSTVSQPDFCFVISKD